MIIDYKVPIVLFATVKKAFKYDDNSIVYFSAPLAAATNLIMSGVVRKRLSVGGMLSEIFTEKILQSLLLVMIMFVVLTLMYVATSIFDFITGLSASKKEWTLIPAGVPRGYIKSDKLWSSVWKFCAVMIIGSIFTVFTMLFVFVGPWWLYDAFLLLLIMFYFMVISFDIHSIGENQERRFGKKPLFYDSLDEAFTLMKNLLTLRIRRIFMGEDSHRVSHYEPEEYNDENIEEDNLNQ